MEELKRQKLINFANDPAMMEAVYDILLNNFLKEKSQYEVYTAAAERIAVDFLKKAWRELDGYRVSNKNEEKVNVNVGL